MLRAASAKFASTSEPPMKSALLAPIFSSVSRSAAVLASLIATLSTTIRAPSLAFELSACFRASARTFLGRSKAWLRTTGPWAVAGAAGALLLVHLLARTRDLVADLDLVGAGAALGELPGDAALQDVGADLGDAEDLVSELHRDALAT